MNVRVIQAGDAALIVEYDESIDPAVNAHVIATADRIRSLRLPGIRDVVPTFRSVAVYFDPLMTDGQALHALLQREAEAAAPSAGPTRQPVRIPVCYGGDLGPDLESVAARAGLTNDEVVQLHAGETYRVFMLGFVPGFAYMGLVNARIATPRLATPRVRVPAGSVGIAGEQTGIYPIETPGGWQLIGRTPLRPFDLHRAEPFLLKAGDAVRFYPIDRSTYVTWQAEHSGRR